MLRSARGDSAGFSIIELVVVMAIVGIMMAIAVPTFGKWTADASVRAVAENLANAVRQTQSMAISQGRISMFALTADAPPVVGSTPAAGSPNWFAALNPLGGSDETATALGLILKSTDATRRSVAITGPALICFNSLGRQSSGTPSLGACSVQASDAVPTTYLLSRTGATRKFEVQVFLGGRVRMCDAAKILSATNPDGC